MLTIIMVVNSASDPKLVVNNQEQIILALLALFATLLGILGVAIKGMTHAKATNAAVNDVGHGELRIYEKVTRIDNVVARLEAAQEDFDTKGWAHGLPPDIDSAPGLTNVIREIQHKDTRNEEDHRLLAEKLDHIAGSLDDHVKWEESQKYPHSKEES